LLRINAAARLAFNGTSDCVPSFFGEHKLPPTWKKEFAMPDVVERVMQTYSMMKSVNEEKLEETREILLDFLSKRPGADEHTAAVEALTFLRNLKT
jgi:hypothetical protein